MKTLYVNLNNEQIQRTHSYEVLNYNLLDDFFYYLGDGIVEDLDFHADKISLIEEFNIPENASDFDEILKQWEELKSILFSEKPEGTFEITLPNGYIDWLRYNSNDEYRKIYSLKYSNNGRNVVSIDIDDFYTSCIKGDLLRRINSHVNRNHNIDKFVIGIDKIDDKSFFIDEIKRNYHTTNVSGLQLYNMTFAQKDNKWGGIDRNGNIIIPFIYDNIWYNKGVVNYKNEDMSYYTNLEFCGKPVTYKYEFPYLYVTKNQSIFIDFKGRVITYCICEESKSVFSCGLIGVKKNGKWGFIDMKGNSICPFEFHYVHDFERGFAIVTKNNRYGVIDTKGMLIISLIYDDCIILDDNLFAVKKNDQWGVVDDKKNTIIPLNYNNIHQGGEGLIAVKKNDKWGFVDYRGNIVIPYIYDYVGSFERGLAIVWHNEKSGVIDVKGNLKIPFIYDCIKPFCLNF